MADKKKEVQLKVVESMQDDAYKGIARIDAETIKVLDVKRGDVILIKGKTASAASLILENYTASYDATVITKLKNAGAIFLGRTNADEFSMGGSGENSAFGPTKNPYDLERVSGGSSR